MKIAIDRITGEVITAEEASKRKKFDREYKCMNKECSQEVILCARESTVVKPYFRVKKGETHINNCPYEFFGNIKKYEKEKISIDKFFLDISKIQKEKIMKEKKKNLN